MINKFYNILIKTAHFLLRLYWKIIQPTTIGVRAIIINSQGNFLLVKHRSDKRWYLPGGKVNRNETLLEALKRELKEELAFSLPEESELEILGCYSSFKESKSDHIIIFIVNLHKLTLFTNLEISESNFFSYSDLPEKISPGTLRRIQEYKKGKKENITRW